MRTRLARRLAICLVFLIAGQFLAPTFAAAEAGDDTEFFEKRIRPILAERCERCHSAAKGKTNGGLALDTRLGWQKGGDSGPPVIPKRTDESLLIRAVGYGDSALQMPPKDDGGKLTDAEIAALTEWVLRGAPDTRTAAPRTTAMTADEARTWWSFQKLRPVVPPEIPSGDTNHNEIDRFVLAEIAQRQLVPAALADRHTLLRRATFDLTGLPPRPTEIAAFLNDSAEDAFEKVFDRLLDSPAFGQRWARHWLDVVRYADFYDANPKTRVASCEITEAWRYRDWVVDSFNNDLPFDQFIKHQIAGDLLPIPPGREIYPEGLIATTFLSNGVWDRGDADKEKIVSDMADDNIDTIGKAFLGLTLGCARCHDHKFDPVTTDDYYGLAGIFYSSHILQDLGAKGAEYVMNRVPLVPPSVLAKRQHQAEELKQANSKIAALDQRQRYRELAAGGFVLVPSEFQSAVGATGSIGDDGSVTVQGSSGKDTYTLKLKGPGTSDVRYLRLEALTDPSLPANGPGRAGDGNFVVNRIVVTFPSDTGAEQAISLISAKASFEQKGFEVAKAIDDNSDSGWAIDPAEGRSQIAVFEFAPKTKLPPDALLTVQLQQTHSESHTLGRFRLSVADAIPALVPDDNPERREITTERDRLQQELAVPLPLAMATVEGGTPGGLFPNIQDVPIHIRGSYNRLGPVVPRHFPRFLAGTEQPAIDSGSGRRELAEWIASKDNPLTARVIVNRIWQWHFGEGLVRTPSNLGKLGEQPTHPALLDWLSAKLIEDGWSLKQLHRRIMLSATYQRASRIPLEQVHADPENLWLSRFSPRRLEAEAIRDAMLLVSGELDSTPGGPADDDFTSKRRSLYVQTARWDRSSYAMLFDAANPDSSTEKRLVSTVAPQALLFLNHDSMSSHARRLASRLQADVPSDDNARLRYAYLLLFGREATPRELQIASTLLQTSEQDAESRWTELAHVLLCGNEFIYLD